MPFEYKRATVCAIGGNENGSEPPEISFTMNCISPIAVLNAPANWLKSKLISIVGHELCVGKGTVLLVPPKKTYSEVTIGFYDECGACTLVKDWEKKIEECLAR